MVLYIHVSFEYIWQLNLFKLVALQPNASIKSSKEVSEIEITDHSSAEGSSDCQLDANTTSFHSIVQKDTLDKDIDLKDVNIVNECENKENLPSQSNDWPVPLIPNIEKVPIPTSAIVQSSVLLNRNERVEDNGNIEPELSKVHLKFDHLVLYTWYYRFENCE